MEILIKLKVQQLVIPSRIYFELFDYIVFYFLKLSSTPFSLLVAF